MPSVFVSARFIAPLVALVLLTEMDVGAAAAQSAPGASAWTPGPAASGDASQLAGVIDAPQLNAVASTSTVQVGGWFVDQTAQGWAGADDVEVFLGTMDNGRLLAHASFAQDRPDVANALRNSFWTPSGYSANVPASALNTGANTLSVYIHTPARGWWFRQVNINNAPPRGTPPPAAAPAPTVGYDISYPQCPSGSEGFNPAFGIVGVNGGMVYTSNPCLARQFAWALSARSPAQPHVSLYMNTGNPGPSSSGHWPVAGSTTPKPCDGSASNDCAYDYGWFAAQDSFARAVAVAGGGASSYPWWLDVESANSWSTDQSNNAADLEGALDFLHSVGVGQTGVYSTSTDWGSIVGSPAPTGSGPFAALLNWRPGAHNLQEAPDWCSRTVTGGRVKFVQYPNGSGVDADYACF